MNFLELVQFVHDEGDRAPHTIDTVQVDDDTDEQVAKIVRWVQQAYRNIQRWGQFLEYGRTESGTLITTVAGTGDYTVSNVKAVIPDSIYCRVEATPTDDWPLIYMTYKQWRDHFVYLSNDLNQDRPIWFVEVQNGKFRLEPKPNDVYEVIADWHALQYTMTQDEDEPIWDGDLHELVAWEALIYYASEYEVPEALDQRIMRSYKPLRQEFLLRYLPPIELNGGDFWP